MSNRLRVERKKRRLSQVKLAALLGVSGPLISDIELGKRMAYPKIRRLAAQFFAVPEGELFPERQDD